MTNIELSLTEIEFPLVRFSGDADRADFVYDGSAALTTEDIAETIFWSVSRPDRVNINSIEIMPTIQSWPALNIFKK